MLRWRYVLGRLLSRWKRTRLVAVFLAKRQLFRLLSVPWLLSYNDSVCARPVSIRPEDRILVLAPHSDDESIGCGGLLARYAAQIDVVCITNGAQGDPLCPRETLIPLREYELRQALALAGVRQVYFLGVEDQRLTQAVNPFAAIDVSRYQWIFLPNFLDQHPDHKAVTQQLQQHLRQQSSLPALQIAFYEIWGTLPVWNAYTLLDESTWSLKQAMIACFQSQIKQIDYAKRIYGLHVYRGIAVGCAAVEAYLSLSIDDFLAIL